MRDKSLPESQHKEARNFHDNVSLSTAKLGKTVDVGSKELLILREPSLLSAVAVSTDTHHRYTVYM